MIGEIVATLGLIYDYAEEHPDIVRMLAERARELLGGVPHDVLHEREAQRALAAGFAAARANAVQAVGRRGVTSDRAHDAVAAWELRTTTRNQLALQQVGVRELCAELLRDVAWQVRT